jgi:hypothetical protein
MNKEQRDQLRARIAEHHARFTPETLHGDSEIVELLDHCDKLEAELSELGTKVSDERFCCHPIYIKRYPNERFCCHPIYIKRYPNGERQTTTITLSEYHRSNLLWLMCDVCGYDRKDAAVHGLNTGDWNGEIPNALRCTEDNGPYEEPTQPPNSTTMSYISVPAQAEANKLMQEELAKGATAFLTNASKLNKLVEALEEICQDANEQAEVDESQGGRFNEGAAVAYRNMVKDIREVLSRYRHDG